jgi:hypothetical protein
MCRHHLFSREDHQFSAAADEIKVSVASLKHWLDEGIGQSGFGAVSFGFAVKIGNSGSAAHPDAASP